MSPSNKRKSSKVSSNGKNGALRDAEQHLMKTYRRPPAVFLRGKGCYLYDSAGNAYLDFLGGIAVNALGYSHPRLVRVIQREAKHAVHFSNLFHSSFQGPLAKKLAEWSGLDRVFFTNSGTEAVEGALKLARAYVKRNANSTGRPKTRILALENSFHGRTFGAVSVTYPAKYREPFEPLVPGAEFVRFNDVADLQQKFTSDVCAIIMEPIQGEGGITAISNEFWSEARKLATANGATLIADEIQCGLGRTGRHFAFQKFAEKPDIVTVAKPLAGGLPLGAVVANEKFAEAFTPGIHGTTFGGGPLVCATALEFLKIVEQKDLLKNVRERSAEIVSGLKSLQTRFDFIREVRGEGLILGLDLSIEGAPIVEEAMRQRLIINCTHEHILRFLPPFIIRKKDVQEFLGTFTKVLEKAPRKAWVPQALHSQDALRTEKAAGAKGQAQAVAR